MLSSVDFEDVIKDFALAKSRKRTFLHCVLHCNCKCMQQGCKWDLCLWISKQYRCPAFKMMYNAVLQWSKKLRILACKWDPMVRDRNIWFSVRDEIETKTFRHFHEIETFGNYVSRPRRRDRDYIPAQIANDLAWKIWCFIRCSGLEFTGRTDILSTKSVLGFYTGRCYRRHHEVIIE